jgi:hypothetical protein
MYLQSTALDVVRQVGFALQRGQLLVGTDDCVAAKVVPPTLHIRVQIRLEGIGQLDSTW